MSDQHPRIRWAGIVFGALFALVAGAGMLVAMDPDILQSVQQWMRPVAFSVGPSTIPFAVIVGLGVVLIAIAAVAMARRGRRSRDRPGSGVLSDGIGDGETDADGVRRS